MEQEVLTLPKVELAEFEKARDRALRLLARRDHSALELKNKLKQKIKINDSVWDQLLGHLKELGYMADENDLAVRWVKQWREEGRGRHWMVGKLKTKGLRAPELRDDEEEIQAARHFLEKKLRGATSTEINLQMRAKLNRALTSRGFSGFVISNVLKFKK